MTATPSTFGLCTFTLTGLLSTFLAILTIYLSVLSYFSKRKRQNVPPTYSGFIPWVGCAIPFGKNPLEFIDEKRKQLGPTFTLYVAGEKMTVLTQQKHFSYFFDESLSNFQAAVKDVVANIASLDEASFYTYHTKVHDVVRGKLVSSKLNGLEENLCHQFNIHVNSYVQPNVKVDLMEAIRCSMYRGVINNLFGNEEECLQIKSKADFETFVDNFKKFDKHFERGARLPSIFLPQWTKARNYLLKAVKPITSKLLFRQLQNHSKTTLLEDYIHVLDEKCADKYAVLLLWASLANAIPITFWTLAHILGNQQIENKLRQKLDHVFNEPKDRSLITITCEDLKKIPYLRCCVMEAIRLQSVGVIARRVTKDFKMEDYVIEEGSMLMISPYWINRDESLFDNPTVYIPERWEEKGTSLDGFLGFGGGRYRCPGRRYRQRSGFTYVQSDLRLHHLFDPFKWFALMEIELYVALFLLKFRTTVHSPIPKADLSHIVGTQQPLSPFFVTCETR